MAIEGSLSDVSLADIFQLLGVGRKTGCLTVTNRSDFGYIYFENGRVTFATVLNRPDRLGELLVRNGSLSQADLTAAMEEQAREPGDRLGQILVSRGHITEQQLLRFIAIQIEEAVYHLFSWSEGSFHFDPDQRPEEEAFLLSINPESLLLEGARRVDEWSLIEKKVPSFDLVFSMERDPTVEAGVELTPEQRKIVGLLDGERTVRDLIDASGLVEFEVAKALYGLVQAGFARRSGQRAAPVGQGQIARVQQHLNLATAFYRAGMMEDAEREMKRALELDPSQARARAKLSLILLKSGRFREALAHLDELPEAARKRYGLLRNRALALEHLARFDEALNALAEAHVGRPTDPDVLLSRAIVLLKARRSREAYEAFRRYRKELGGQRPPPLYYAFAVLAAAVAGKLEEALTLGREGLGYYPEEGPILVNTGVILERNGDLEASEALFLRAVSEAPVPAQAHKNLGDLAYRRGDQAGARAHYERAVRLDPRLGDDVYLKLGVIAYEETDRDVALRLWRRALELNPRNEVVRTNLELLSAATGR